MSYVDINRRGTINWDFLIQFYNLKTIILNYNFNGNYLENEIYLPTQIIILRHNDIIKGFSDNIYDVLTTNIVFIIKNSIFVLHIIIEDLTKNISGSKLKLRSYDNCIKYINY